MFISAIVVLATCVPGFCDLSHICTDLWTDRKWRTCSVSIGYKGLVTDHYPANVITERAQVSHGFQFPCSTTADLPPSHMTNTHTPGLVLLRPSHSLTCFLKNSRHGNWHGRPDLNGDLSLHFPFLSLTHSLNLFL